ncbi:SWIM zinc finger family protein [Sporolactobacillus pectinivorans]|uniref:SWIM zinc finger family protein n=1 Tax=Sporolactobacillus pectinivorans TaxID=1591408 RepID=UPI000C25F4DD|nr:SWIM zinc finger family protein [Sporolactobacillus pectinivorans]
MSTLYVHSPALADWLTKFAETMETLRFERGLFLCRNGRVWDYHASGGAIHASVEDRQSSFYEVEINWKNGMEHPGDPEFRLPDPAKGLSTRCTCGYGPRPCAHVAAAMIYRINDLDKKFRSRRSSLSPVTPDYDDAAYRRLLAKFRAEVENISPTFENFDAAKLHLRPDFHDQMSRISSLVMDRYGHKTSE